MVEYIVYSAIGIAAPYLWLWLPPAIPPIPMPPMNVIDLFLRWL